MRLIVNKTEKMHGSVTVPPSKSHTHRAIILASLASGTSVIRNPLLSDDCLATIEACRAIGAEIEMTDELKIKGVNGKPKTPQNIIDVNNSGTTIRLMTAITSLCGGSVTLTGDNSIQKRPIEPLLSSLRDLGVEEARSVNDNGTPPVIVKGRIKGGNSRIEGMSSQFLTGLLFTCPLAESNTELEVLNLKSRPYARMTLNHLERVGISIQESNMTRFNIPGKQVIQPADYTIPGDYSSASFLLAASNITESEIDISGLDPDDEQGDKMIINIIEKMNTGTSREIDLGDTPDLLPITAVLGCYAEGNTILKNVEHARLKESDRIAAICCELKKMNANIEERKDGLIVSKSQLRGANVNGYKDHRIVMALAVAGLRANGTTSIENAESISISFPGFVETMQKLQANVQIEKQDGNSFGRVFRLFTFGESHGDAVGAVIEGCPVGMEISLDRIQNELDRRRPGKGPLTSGRNEPDKLEIISGIKDGKSTGEPIKLQVRSVDKRSRDYDNILHKPRPGHADLTYFIKYGRIPVGGGRASGRETVGRVLGGAIAKQILITEGITINGRVIEVLGKEDDQEKTILDARDNKDSVGGIVEITAEGVPPGLGEPVFDKLDADLAKALISIGAVKGVEFGAGFESSKLKGSENNDSILIENGRIVTATNNAGGILGGISNGMPIICRIAVKPTSSIELEQDTVDLNTMQPTKLSVTGRHDPCICQRIVPVAEAMVALVIVDHLLSIRKY